MASLPERGQYNKPRLATALGSKPNRAKVVPTLSKVKTMSTIATTSIEIDDKGVAWVADTNTKVIEVVLDKVAHGWSPEEIYFQHYGDLSLAQIHAALAYYYDHQAELDAEIKRRAQEGDELAKKASNPTLREKLLALKRQQQ